MQTKVKDSAVYLKAAELIARDKARVCCYALSLAGYHFGSWRDHHKRKEELFQHFAPTKRRTGFIWDQEGLQREPRILALLLLHEIALDRESLAASVKSGSKAERKLPTKVETKRRPAKRAY